MCYTQAASALLATGCFVIAWYEYRTYKCVQYSVGLAYFGLMEMLQAVQHSWLAVPADGYAMCKNRTNQYLTFLGGLHIVFQPLFCNMAFMGNFRRFDIVDRIHSTTIQQLCVLAALWGMWRYFYIYFYPTNPDIAPTATEACPNYEWLVEGYDPYMKFTTPNLPGHSCTYLSPSNEGHLAWAMPAYQATYIMPGASIHFFLMFAPYVLMVRRPTILILAVLLCFFGPLSSMQDTPHLNEQPAIWCYYSVFQVFFLVAVFRFKGLHKQQPHEAIPARIVVPPGWGEEPLVYVRVMPKNNVAKEDSTDVAPLLPTSANHEVYDETREARGASKLC